MKVLGLIEWLECFDKELEIECWSEDSAFRLYDLGVATSSKDDKKTMVLFIKELE